jgi:hypothetical protein
MGLTMIDKRPAFTADEALAKSLRELAPELWEDEHCPICVEVNSETLAQLMLATLAKDGYAVVPKSDVVEIL